MGGVVDSHLRVGGWGVIKPPSLALKDQLCPELVLSDPSVELQDLLLLSESKNPGK